MSGYFWLMSMRKVVPSASTGISATWTKAGFNAARSAAVVCGRGYSSRSRITLPSSSITGIVAFANRDGGTPLARERDCIERFPADALHRRDGIGAQSLMRLRMTPLQTQIAVRHAAHGAQPRSPVDFAERVHQRHHLRAAGNHQIFHAGHDL